MRKGFSLVLICIGLMVGAEEAYLVTFSGFLNNPGNPALVGSPVRFPSWVKGPIKGELDCLGIEGGTVTELDSLS
jgi:hypothetical protein